MASRGAPIRQDFQPTSTEVTQWQAFAQLAGRIAVGKSHAWRSLRDAAETARSLRVFGPLSRGNVCIRLIEVSLEAVSAADPAPFRDELGRLADEVLKRCTGWAVIRIGEIARG